MPLFTVEATSARGRQNAMYDLDEDVLDERKERAIFLLMEGKTISEVATELGASRTTIYRWKNDDALFKKELNRLKWSAWEAGESKLIAARTAAIDAAIELLEHEDARIKLKAIETILGFNVSRTMGGSPVLSRSRKGR